MKKFYVINTETAKKSIDFSVGVNLGHIHIFSMEDVANMENGDRNKFYEFLCSENSVQNFGIVTDAGKTDFDIIRAAYDFANTDIDNIIENDIDVFSVSVPWCGTACRFPNLAHFYNCAEEFFTSVIDGMLTDGDFLGIDDILLNGDHLNG